MWNFICEMIPISSKPSSSSMSRSISSTINERKAQAYALLCQFLDCFFLVLPNKENDHLFEFALDLRTCEDFWKIIQVKNSSLSISLSFTFIFYSWPLLPSLYKLSYHFQIGLMDKGSLISKRCIYIMKRVVDFSNGQSLGEEGKEIQIKKPWTKYDKMRNGRIYYLFLKKNYKFDRYFRWNNTEKELLSRQWGFFFALFENLNQFPVHVIQVLQSFTLSFSIFHSFF